MSSKSPAKPPICHAWALWKNPIFLRYCRSRLRPTALAVSLLISLLIAGFFFQMTRTVGYSHSTMEVSDIERGPLIPLIIVQLLFLFVLGTAQACGGMTAERDEGVIDYQRLLPMTPAAKVVGFLFGLPVREYIMALSIVPFVAWGIWKGRVPSDTWLPLFFTIASTTLLYHLTGLITGTIVKNRRWAFLVSIGIIFLLYTAVPQLAKAGLVFFEYFTVTPVFKDAIPHLIPRTAGSMVETYNRLTVEARFFNLDLSECTFTLFAQCCLSFSFFIMLCRRWRNADSHLMSKPLALGLFIWLQIMLLGSSVPIIDTGRIFPSMQFGRYLTIVRMETWEPQPFEGLMIIIAFGIVNMFAIWVLSSNITPNHETQINGWRRATKFGKKRLPFGSDEASALGTTFLMCMIASASWYYFSLMMIESRWFLGHFAKPTLFVHLLLTTVSVSMLIQLLSEAKGRTAVFLFTIFAIIVPIMVAVILGAASTRSVPSAIWIAGISPVMLPITTPMSHISLAELDPLVSRAIPLSQIFWQITYLLITLQLVLYLCRSRKAIRINTQT